jgi:small-conductance mechanosensitive channel
MAVEKKSSKKRVIGYLILALILVVIAITIYYYPAFWYDIWLLIQPWLWFIISIVGILVGYKIVSFIINRYAAKHERFPKDAANGLILIIRIGVIFAILFVVFPVLDIPSEYLINISTIVATAIGFASTIAVSNVVAGFYMLAARPYKIGDYLNVEGAVEGVITEVGLNYTKLKDADNTVYRLPNNKLFSSNITNFSLEPTQKKRENKSLDEKFASLLGDALIERKIVRYVFDIEVTFDPDPEETIKVFDEICDRWEGKFGYKPHYFFQAFGYRAVVRWALFADTPERIMDNSTPFLEDIWFSVYEDKEGDAIK